ncbi:uncharacterized protein [Rhodnius prolixus]|uniref:uncharacterized protein n=1 Tax=Rhodnius prolixus TaxID=13249 RepID=UPI003D18F669
MENPQTLKVIKTRRCGVEDNFTPFIVGSSTTKWGKNDITWYIYPPQYSSVAERAFSIWSKYANLTFKRSHNSPNISIAFARGKHLCITNKSTYCYSPFVDGSGILAHAEYPHIYKKAVEIHLNDAITWHTDLTLPSSSTIKDDDVTSLFWVLVHEIGHGLGLSHSSDRQSLMFPSYIFPHVSSFDELDLFEEEIRAIQIMYGPPLKPPPTTTTTPAASTPSTTTTTTTTTSSPPPVTTTTTTKRPQPPTNQPFMDICYYLKHIGAFLVAHKRLYLFYNNYVWIIPLQESIRLQRDYTRPKMINRWLRFLPANFTHVSGIYQRPNKDIVMIADNHLYIFNYPYLHLTYQEDIQSLLMAPGGVNVSVNAIFHSNTGSTYIIYNKSFVNKFNECDLTSTFIGDVSYIFPGVPRNVKTAFRHTNGRIYFKSDDLFYSFNEFLDSVTDTIEDSSVLFNIVCNQNSILNQLQHLLNKLTMNLQLEEKEVEAEEE